MASRGTTIIGSSLVPSGLAGSAFFAFCHAQRSLNIALDPTNMEESMISGKRWVVGGGFNNNCPKIEMDSEALMNDDKKGK